MFDGGIDGMIERLQALDTARARLDAEAADLLDELDRALRHLDVLIQRPIIAAEQRFVSAS